MKETLRLWPAASTMRKGDADGTFFIRDPKTGNRLPTKDLNLFVVHYAIQRNPDLWGESADTFEPSRFMPEQSSTLPENAWRPFEKGPRNCIGQELALLEAKIILAMVVRSFDFEAAYDRLEELKNDGSLYALDESWRKGIQEVDGEVAYQVSSAVSTTITLYPSY